MLQPDAKLLVPNAVGPAAGPATLAGGSPVSHHRRPRPRATVCAIAGVGPIRVVVRARAAP
jgi:hypothetical protein